jgi:hypothetical protein
MRWPCEVTGPLPRARIFRLLVNPGYLSPHKAEPSSGQLISSPTRTIRGVGGRGNAGSGLL